MSLGDLVARWRERATDLTPPYHRQDSPDTGFAEALRKCASELEAAQAERDDLRRRLNIAEAALEISQSLNEALRADNVRLRGEANGHRKP